MDRPIDPEVRRRERNGRWLRLVGVAALLLLAAATARDLLRPTLKRADIRTAVVDVGTVAATLEASGMVRPEHEHVLTSPADTRVLTILKSPGDRVAKGDAIVLLDNSAARLEVERLERQLALKANQREQAGLDLDKALGDLASETALKALELESHEYRAARDRSLRDMGLVVADVVRESETLVARDRIELEQVRGHEQQARRALAVKLAALELEQTILRGEADQARRLLALGTVSSEAAGVVTWVVGAVGSAARRGEEVARVADLSSFKVEATLSDVHSAAVRAGQEVVVETAGLKLAGHVSHVRPTVEDGTVRLDVALDEASSPTLRDKLRVEVHVLSARNERALRVKPGSFLLPDGSTAAFVVRGTAATRQSIRLGIRGLDAVEISEGLAAGDEVIISDMSEYSSLKEVRIR